MLPTCNGWMWYKCVCISRAASLSLSMLGPLLRLRQYTFMKNPEDHNHYVCSTYTKPDFSAIYNKVGRDLALAAVPKDTALCTSQSYLPFRLTLWICDLSDKNSVSIIKEQVCNNGLLSKAAQQIRFFVSPIRQIVKTRTNHTTLSIVYYRFVV